MLLVLALLAVGQLDADELKAEPAFVEVANFFPMVDLVEDDVYFGQAVAMDGNTMVVAAREEDALAGSAGAAYVFVDTGAGWSEQQKLSAGDGAASDRFGASVAVDGDTILIGAARHSAHGSLAGSAYVFTGSGGVWTQQQELLSNDLEAGDQLGHSVTLDGDTAVVSALYDDHPGGADAGSAYVFVRSGVTWSQQQRLTAGDAASGDSFGWSVAISSDTVAVGAMSDDRAAGTDAGSAMVFELNGPLFSDGFESGDTTRWSTAVR